MMNSLESREFEALLSNSENAPVSRRYDMICCFLTALCGVSIGMSMAYSAPTDQEICSHDNACTQWFSSTVLLGAVAGSIMASCACVSPRTVILCAHAPLTAGWLMISVWWTGRQEALLTGRVLTGVAAGMLAQAVPHQITDLAARHVRGRAGSAFNFFITTGFLFIYSMSAAVRARYLAMSCSVIGSAHFLGMLYTCESPRWLLWTNKMQEAKDTIALLRGNDYVLAREEYTSLVEATEDSMNIQHGHTNVCTSDCLKRLLLSCSALMFQQLSGVTVVGININYIFSEAGFGQNGTLPAVLTSLVMLLFGLLAIRLIESCGRRWLFVLSSIGLALAFSVLGTYFYLKQHSGITISAWVALVAAFFINASFAIGWGPVAWVFSAEIAPRRGKSLFAGISTAVNWLSAFVIVNTFYGIKNKIKLHGALWLYAAFNVLSLYIVMLYPETRGRSIESLNENLYNVRIQ